MTSSGILYIMLIFFILPSLEIYNLFQQVVHTCLSWKGTSVFKEFWQSAQITMLLKKS